MKYKIPIDLSVFGNADMHIWHGSNSQVEHKLQGISKMAGCRLCIYL